MSRVVCQICHKSFNCVTLSHLKKHENRECECGCKEVFECKINSKKRFIHGHNNRGKKRAHELRVCLGCGIIFEIVRWEKRRFCSSSCSNRYHNSLRKGQKRQEYIIKKGQETRKNWSDEKKRKVGQNISQGEKSSLKKKQSGQKISEKLKGRFYPEEWKEKQKETWKKKIDGGWISPLKGRKLSNEHIKKIFISCEIKPNQLEIEFSKFLYKYMKNQWKYVGDGQIFIGGRCPDFININGQKKIIELFGDYWHSKKQTGRSKIEEERQRIDRFAIYGFKTLIIWENEFKDEISVLKKIEEFINE